MVNTRQPLWQIQARAELELRRREQSEPAKVGFTEFINQVHSTYRWLPYLEQLADLLQQVVDDKLTRLMIFAPPRHGKSEMVSRLFSAYYLYRHPDRWVGLVSYGADMSYTFSRSARDNYLRLGGQLKGDAATIKNWETGRGGGVWSAGIGGPITGRGFHLGIIDDPIKNAEEASSLVVRQRNNEWLDSVFWTRQEPVNAMVIIQTRWNRNDVASYLLSKEEDEPEGWHIVNFQAIKGDGPKYPASCILEPDNRQEGQPLNPERYPKEKLLKIKKRIGSYFWNCLYQQNPIAKKGLVYHQFSGVAIGPLSSEIDHSQAEGYWHSHDFGAVNRAWMLFIRIKGIFYLIHEEILPQGTTAARAVKIKAHFTGRKVIAGYGGTKSESQQVIDYYKEGVRIRVPIISDVEGQIDKANKMLQNGTLKICSDMTLTIDQLQNCVRDSKEQIQDKSTWHFCFVAGTLVSTIDGLKPIEQIKIGDKVKTRFGYQKVTATGQRERQEVISLSLSNGNWLTGTGDHPIFLDNYTSTRLDSLRYGDIIQVDKIYRVELYQWQKKRFSGLRESPITDTLIQVTNQIEDISDTRASIFTGLFGSSIMGLFQKGIKYITETIIQPITNWTIWNWSKLASILKNTICLMSARMNYVSGSMKYDLLQKSGIVPMRAGSGIASTQKRSMPREKKFKSGVLFVGQHSQQEIEKAIQDFVQTTVSQPVGESQVLTTRHVNVSGAEAALPPTNIAKQDTVHVIALWPQKEKETVYNITVDQYHHYYANGVLVSNCDCLRYFCAGISAKGGVR